MADFAGTTVRKLNERFSLEQWRTWNDGERWELIDGQAFTMSTSTGEADGGRASGLALGPDGTPEEADPAPAGAPPKTERSAGRTGT